MSAVRYSLPAATLFLAVTGASAFEMSLEDWKGRCPAIITSDQLKARGMAYGPVDTRPRAKYPLDMERANESGIVTVLLRVDTSGAVVDHEVIKATHSAFVPNALKSVTHYRYAPLTIDGGPTCVEATVDVEFKYY